MTLDAYAAKAVRDWQVPGLAISVVKEGRVLFSKGYGVRELGRATPADTQTLFAIGSTTKVMTAVALAVLVDEGRVRWDDPVTRHLPWFQTGDPYVTRELTVRDLLTQRGGLGNADYLWYESEIPAAEARRRVRFLRSARSATSNTIVEREAARSPFPPSESEHWERRPWPSAKTLRPPRWCSRRPYAGRVGRRF